MRQKVCCIMPSGRNLPGTLVGSGWRETACRDALRPSGLQAIMAPIGASSVRLPMSASQENLLEAYDITSERHRSSNRRGVRQNSRLARTGPRFDPSRPVPRLRLPARADATALSCGDPRGKDRRSHAGAGSDAFLALCLSRNAGGLGGILAADAPAGLARSAVADQARRGNAGRRPASLHGQSAVFQGRAGVAAAHFAAVPA